MAANSGVRLEAYAEVKAEAFHAHIDQ